MALQSLALFCGSSTGKNLQYKTLAYQFGEKCAQRKITLYYGGAALGLMQEAAQGCMDSQGKVIGIAPDFFSKETVLNAHLNDLILVKSMSERKQMLEAKADAFVVFPGSYGTMDEFFEVLTDAQLGLHQKPIVIFNLNGYYDPLIAQIQIFQKEGFLRTFHHGLFQVATDIEEIFEKLNQYKNDNNPEWLEMIKR